MPIPATITVATTSTTPRLKRRISLARPRPPVRGGALFALALAAALLITLSAPRLVAGLLIFDQEPVLRLIQRGAPSPAERLIEARRAYEGALAWHGGAAERTALASIRLRLALALGTASPGGRAVLESAREALREA